MVESYAPETLRRLQLTELEILKVCAVICDELGIDSWFVDSGTCLGAMRHQGFIPWDDDIDIGMKLEHYRLFCEKAPDLLPEEYGLYTHATTSNYPPLWAKVYKKGTHFIGESMHEAGFDQGIFVDVFAYVQLDSMPAKAKKQCSRFITWQRMSYLYYLKHPKIENVIFKPLVKAGCVVAHALVRILYSPDAIERRFCAAIESGDGMGAWTDAFYAQSGTFATDTLFPTVLLDFEDTKVPVPHDTHVYLTEMYGDYMQLPPEEERAAAPAVVLDFGDGINWGIGVL